MMMKENIMTLAQFEDLFNIHDNLYDDLFGKYMEFIQENADPSERVICNGDMLIEAAEDGYLFEEFYEHCMKAGLENI